MSRKRSIEELEDFTAVEQPIDSATLHGALTSLSPVKKGHMANYFDGTITDGNTELQLVGFNSEHQRKMNTFFSNKKSITLQNCQIKEARQGHKMEIIARKFCSLVDKLTCPTSQHLQLQSFHYLNSTPYRTSKGLMSQSKLLQSKNQHMWVATS